MKSNKNESYTKYLNKIIRTTKIKLNIKSVTTTYKLLQLRFIKYLRKFLQYHNCQENQPNILHNRNNKILKFMLNNNIIIFYAILTINNQNENNNFNLTLPYISCWLTANNKNLNNIKIIQRLSISSSSIIFNIVIIIVRIIVIIGTNNIVGLFVAATTAVDDFLRISTSTTSVLTSQPSYCYFRHCLKTVLRTFVVFIIFHFTSFFFIIIIIIRVLIQQKREQYPEKVVNEKQQLQQQQQHHHHQQQVLLKLFLLLLPLLLLFCLNNILKVVGFVAGVFVAASGVVVMVDPLKIFWVLTNSTYLGKYH